LLSGEVMIGNDQIDSKAARSLCGTKCSNSRVDADNETHAGRSGTLNDIIFHAIAFANPVRNVEIGSTAAEFNSRLENDNGGCAIPTLNPLDHKFFPSHQPPLPPPP